MVQGIRYGVDLGGTKIEAIALAADTGQELARLRTSSPRGDYGGTVRAVADLVRSLQHNHGPGSVGIGIPGTISPQTGLVKNANSTWMIGHPFGEDLGQALGQAVRIANDADCLALSEATDGAAAGCPLAFAVILGTGVGGGLVAHGRVLTGPNAIGGEWGHNPLPWMKPEEYPGALCYCGRRGCIETFLSGPGLAADHAAQGTSTADHAGQGTSTADHAAQHGRAEQALTAAEIADRAQAGDADCLASLHRYADRLARGLASVINVFDPHAIVLGGGLSNIPLLYDLVPTLWGPWVFSDHVATRLLPSRHGDSSGVRGAAWLWDQGSEQRLRAVGG